MTPSSAPADASTVAATDSGERSENGTPGPSPVPAPASPAEGEPLTEDELGAEGGLANASPTVKTFVEALRAHDVQALLVLIDWGLRECVRDWKDGIPSPPECAPTEAPGTAVEAFLIGGNEGSYYRRDGVQDFLREVVRHDWYVCEAESEVVHLRRGVRHTPEGEAPSFLVFDLSAVIHGGRVAQLAELVTATPEIDQSAC